MRALDIILKKRSDGELSQEEIAFLVQGAVQQTIPPYQLSAWLMAVFFRGMTPQEIAHLTREMIASGETIVLPKQSAPYVDKHSTGGVGDKISLILAPWVAACGVKVPMMSGRSLGHTGGTLDKLDAIPGYTTSLSPQRFAEIITECGFAMTGQAETIVPADRLFYALRDVTGTVESIPLITASILSKKCAEGADVLVFDVKCGAGAFMKTLDEARNLAQLLIQTGKQLGKRIVAVISRMEQPLGGMVGNFLEVEEAAICLGGWHSSAHNPQHVQDLMEVTERLAQWMLIAAGVANNHQQAGQILQKQLENGHAWECFLRNIELQGGNVPELKQRLGRFRASHQTAVLAPTSGYLHRLDAFALGLAGTHLGIGRAVASDRVLPQAGIALLKKTGDRVVADEPLCLLYGEETTALEEARPIVAQAYQIMDKPLADQATSGMILDEISAL